MRRRSHIRSLFVLQSKPAMLSRCYTHGTLTLVIVLKNILRGVFNLDTTPTLSLSFVIRNCGL